VEAGADMFAEAAQLCGKEVEVDVVYTGNWADVNLAYEAGQSLVADGADVLFHILDTADAGLIAAAEDEGVMAIGLYRDSSDLGPNAVIGSALGHPGTMIYELACGHVPQGEKSYLTVNTPLGAGIHMTDLTPADVQDRVNAIYQQMLDDELVILNFGEEEATAEETAVEEKIKVAATFPGVVSDQSWNQFGYEGLKRAEEECGVEIAYSEDVFQDEQIETFRNYAAEGYDIIIAHGGEYADSITIVANEYPDLWFGMTNGLSDAPNVSSMIIGYNQMTYLAGVLACEMTESDHIAFVGGESIPVVEAGADMFAEAAQLCGKEVEVDVVYTGNWADVNLAYEAGQSLVADGADVLFHILDTADAGLIAAAEDEGVMAIGLYRDSSDLGPDAVIGSALGHPGTMIYELACGRVPQGEKSYLTVNTPLGAGIHMTDLTPADVQDRVNAIYQQMLDDELVILNFGEE
jgi:basic membrane protein A